MENKKKVAFYTLGCKLNFSETSTIARNFQDEGFDRVDFEEVADMYVINTCSVTENADKQYTQEISPDIETGILKKLEKFEQSKKYLEKDMTLSKMAVFLNTNTKYVTKTIAKHRGKGTIDYITDLKINYITENQKKDRNESHPDREIIALIVNLKRLCKDIKTENLKIEKKIIKK